MAGGLIGGGLSFFKGNNFWTGQEIAPGRSAFSFKNTPINMVEHPEAMSFSPEEALAALPDDPLLNNMNHTQMTPYSKGQMGVNDAMMEFKADGGIVYGTEISVDVPDGVGGMIRNRFDFVGELDGQLHLFEIKNGVNAGLTPNQQINLPKLMNQSSFIFRGGNAYNSQFLRPFVNKPYTSTNGFVVVYKHYF